LSPNVLFGDKTQTANHNKQNNSYNQVTLSLFEISEIGHWIIWDLAFAICDFKSCQKACARMFYRVWQNLTSQVLKVF